MIYQVIQDHFKSFAMEGIINLFIFHMESNYPDTLQEVFEGKIFSFYACLSPLSARNQQVLNKEERYKAFTKPLMLCGHETGYFNKETINRPLSVLNIP